MADALVVEGLVDAATVRRCGIQTNPRKPRTWRKEAQGTERLAEEGLIQFAPELLAATHEGGDPRRVTWIKRTEACGEFGEIA